MKNKTTTTESNPKLVVKESEPRKSAEEEGGGRLPVDREGSSGGGRRAGDERLVELDEHLLIVLLHHRYPEAHPPRIPAVGDAGGDRAGEREHHLHVGVADPREDAAGGGRPAEAQQDETRGDLDPPEAAAAAAATTGVSFFPSAEHRDGEATAAGSTASVYPVVAAPLPESLESALVGLHGRPSPPPPGSGGGEGRSSAFKEGDATGQRDAPPQPYQCTHTLLKGAHEGRWTPTYG